MADKKSGAKQAKDPAKQAKDAAKDKGEDAKKLAKEQAKAAREKAKLEAKAAREAAKEARDKAKAEAKAAREKARVERDKARAEREANRSRRRKERNEKVIHTRVPESLDEELRDRAAALGVSVSNLIRNALNHTFGLVEDVIQDSASVARNAKGDAPRPPDAPATPSVPLAPATPPVAPAVFGWQTCKLSLNAICEQCNEILPKGTEAAVAVMNMPEPRPRALCLACLESELA